MNEKMFNGESMEHRSTQEIHETFGREQVAKEFHDTMPVLNRSSIVSFEFNK